MGTKKERSEAAAIMGRAGGKARARVLSDEQKREIGRKGAAVTNLKRWGTKPKKKSRGKRAKSLDAKRSDADSESHGAMVKAS